MIFDVAVLQEPVDPESAREELRERIDREGRRGGVRAGTAWAVFQTVVLVLGAGVLAALFVLVVQQLAGGRGFGVATIVIAALMVLPLAVVRVRAHLRAPDEVQADVQRLTRFAAANGLGYELTLSEPDRAAALFGVGSLRVAADVVTGSSPRSFEAANYSYETWVARTRMPRSASYVRMDARRALPELTLRTRSRDLPAGAWEPPQGQRPVAVDPVFDARFAVFGAPEAAERIRAVLAPAVRDALVELLAQGDLQIVGGQVFFLSRRHQPLTDPAYWEWVEDLFGLMDILETPGTAVRPAEDPGRRARREALLAVPREGRPFVIGCLLPLVLGAAAAVATALVLR